LFLYKLRYIYGFDYKFAKKELIRVSAVLGIVHVVSEICRDDVETGFFLEIDRFEKIFFDAIVAGIAPDAVLCFREWVSLELLHDQCSFSAGVGTSEWKKLAQ